MHSDIFVEQVLLDTCLHTDMDGHDEADGCSCMICKPA